MGFLFWGKQETIRTGTTDSGGGLRIDDFVDPGPTPGNLAVCLSGGGSRAMTAGMGQLRALAHLQRNGRSLLAQTRALSTVSGGGWIGQTFSYRQGLADAESTPVDGKHWVIPPRRCLSARPPPAVPRARRPCGGRFRSGGGARRGPRVGPGTGPAGGG